MSFLDQVADQLNLRWAWEKVRRAAAPGDVWFDEIELAGFELDLERNLRAIAEEFLKGKYRLRPLSPMAFPKNPNESGIPQVRQYFHISVRDQVAWTAVVNVIGPLIDRRMPPWSYGNRLFRSIWVETDDEGVRRRRIGRYRHASGRIYLPFGQSWPIFRRHVYLAIGAMTSSVDAADLPREDQQELELQVRMAEEQRCPFVMRQYWATKISPNRVSDLFWCSIDLQKFYPSLRLDVIRQNIVDELPTEYRAEADILLASMLKFPLDIANWSNESLKAINLKQGSKTFRNIPTGLYVAGFLANTALLKVDLRVASLLRDRNIAHFRYVDDHIVLAHSFRDLVAWVNEYSALLSSMNTGAKINPNKVEPTELAAYFRSTKKHNKTAQISADLAERACKLDPKFPSPLMTKTLALVSAIAQTDFNLLEESELSSLTDQLEHLLLVDIPESEIPEKTRLSFAATRLAHLTECRLANDEGMAELEVMQQRAESKLEEKALTSEARTRLVREVGEIADRIRNREKELEKEARRTFLLLLKVLRERPDRVRLWTRAIQICRITGVKGLSEIWTEISNYREVSQNHLASEYLTANTLCLLGTQSIVAAWSLCDLDVAEWRRKAARSFLEDICSTPISTPTNARRQLQVSWQQYCVGIYCAKAILKTKGVGQTEYKLDFPDSLLSVGQACLMNQDSAHQAARWAWWASKTSLRKLEPDANIFVRELGLNLGMGEETMAFWRFFPRDVPDDILDGMSKANSPVANVTNWEGWWYDALKDKSGDHIETFTTTKNRAIQRVRNNLESTTDDNWISLYEWCDGIKKILALDATDPRASEWTALELVRQIADKLALSVHLDEQYILLAKKRGLHERCLHPANFRIPRRWLELPGLLTWEGWKATVRTESNVSFVPERSRLNDHRYSPILWSPLFLEINPVRGLGLLLYGLLKRNFSLPAMWNGPGHSDVLNLLPSLLLKDISCSSITLGVLLSCLQPRVTENLFNRRKGRNEDYYLNDDSLNDPVIMVGAEQVRDSMALCQRVLEENQLSTLGHRARQLTPISIRQLAQPDWNKSFRIELADGGAHD